MTRCLAIVFVLALVNHCSADERESGLVTPRQEASEDLQNRSPSDPRDEPNLRDQSPNFRDQSPNFRDQSPNLRDQSPNLRDQSPDFRDQLQNPSLARDQMLGHADPRNRPDPLLRSREPAEPGQSWGQPDPRLDQRSGDAWLLERIQQLELRIARLETQRSAPSYPQTTSPQQLQGIPPVYSPPQPYLGPNVTQPQWQGARPVQAPTNVPKNWQRFNFNGQWFYIVPVDANQTDSFVPNR